MLWIPLAAIILLVFPAHKSGLRVTLPDMGQGEAIIISTEEGSTILIDGGSLSKKKCGKYLLEPYLLYTGTDRIDYAIVTHPDEDHISGLMELLSGHRIDIKNLVLPDVFSKAGLTAEESKKMGKKNYDELKELAHKAGTRVLFIDEGDTITEGELKITCLFPAKGLHYVSANAYSTVLSLTYGEFDMLLTGDITSQGEDYILRRNLSSQKEGYDILKVAHHGSKYSSKEDFLDIVKPEIALISCGKNNRYGHPHGEVLERLDDIGSEVLITYESGAITIKTDGKRMRVEEFIGDKGTW
jgi:competence protein ComEC